jgi:C-terminal processing protease CtpA/Prc
MSPEQLMAALAPYISHENQSSLRQSSPDLMLVAELLRELNLAEADGRVLFAFVRPDGTNFTLLLPGAQTNTVRLAGIQRSNTPLAAKHPRQAYWHEFLPDSKTLYLQYNRCQNDPAEPFKDFATRLFAAADAQGSERVIVDLRFNGGGNSEIIRPLLSGLRTRPKLCAKGHLCALIGPATFSSGLWAARDLQKLGATLLGEPTGGKPNDYGDVKRFSLPHSRLQVQYATKKFRLVQGNPASLEPDIVVAQSVGDFMVGRDPVLERALVLRAPGAKE